MEPLYLEESIQKKKAAIQSAPELSPYTRYHFVSHFSDQIAIQLARIQKEYEPYHQSSAPSLDANKETQEKLEGLLHGLDHLMGAVEELGDIVQSEYLSNNLILQQSLQERLTHLKLKSDLIHNEIQQTLRVSVLQKEYLLYQASLRDPLTTSVAQTNHQLAGQLLIQAGGEVRSAEKLLVLLAEQSHQPNKENRFLAALSLLQPRDELSTEKTLSEEFTAERGEGEFFTPTPEAQEEPVIPIAAPTSEIPISPEPESPALTEEKDASNNYPENPTTVTTAEEPKKKTITRSEYYKIRDEVTQLRENYEEALQRQVAIQKEIGADITKASKEQNTKMVQIRTAVQDIHAKLKAAADRLDKLNRDIRDGKIEIEKPKKTINTQKTQTRKPQTP